MNLDPTKPTVEERLLHAFSSSDLSLNPLERCDADYLIALGRAHQLGKKVSSPLMRLKVAGTQSDYRAARAGAGELAIRMNHKRRWRLSALNAREVGELALAHHVFPACPACHGRKFEVAEGAPLLSGHICQPCHGTGVRPVQRKFNTQIRDVMQVLSEICEATERAVSRMLR